MGNVIAVIVGILIAFAPWGNIATRVKYSIAGCDKITILREPKDLIGTVRR